MSSQRLFSALLILASLFATAFAVADLRVFPTPSMQTAAVGEIVTVDVMFEPSQQEPVIGGGFDVVFDPSVLAYVDHAYGDLGTPKYSREPDVLVGRLESFSVADFSGLLDAGLVVSVRFRVLTSGASRVATEATQGIGGPWIDGFYTVEAEYGAALVAATGYQYPMLEVAAVTELGIIEPGAIGAGDVVVRNNGTGPLDIYRIELVAINTPESLSIFQDGCSGAQIPAGGQCAVTFRFAPTAMQAQRVRRATLHLKTSDIIDIDPQFRIEGRIASPILRSPRVNVWDAFTEPPYRAIQTYVENVGQLPGTIDRITGLIESFELLDDQCSGVTLKPTQRCTLRIQFAPGQPGYASTIMRIYYSDELFVSFTTLSGLTSTGITDIDLGGPNPWVLSVGESERRDITITNKGTTAMSLNVDPIDLPVLTGIQSTCSDVVLEPGAICVITLFAQGFEPSSTLWAGFMQTDSLVFNRSPTLQIVVE